MQRPKLKKLIILMACAGSLSATNTVSASGFQIWEQDAGSVGNYHAGRAALANDASIAFYNPAGITRIKNQQFVFAGLGVLTDIQYRGTISVNTFRSNVPQPVTAQGGVFAFLPNIHYVAPITDRVGFGFDVAVPFASKVAYGRQTFLRYASTMAEVQVVDITPSLGFNITPEFSVGFGLDAQKMSAEFDQYGVLGNNSDTDSTNKGFDTAYGYRLGALYQFNPDSRIGLSFNSQVVHHLAGSSKFVGPITNIFNHRQPIISRDNTNVTLPPFLTLSMYQKLFPAIAVMGTVTYTEWSFFRNLYLQNISGIAPGGFFGRASTTITVNIPQYFRNTWSVAAGADYYVSDRLTLRTGAGYDQTPTNNSYRNVQLPDGNRYAVAFGGHYQINKAFGVDLGWTHLFIQGAGEISNINPPVQQDGAEKITTRGSVNSNADVFGAQLVWDIC